MRSSSAAKVGVVIIMAAVALVGSWAYLSRMELGTYTVHVVFTNAQGIYSGTPARMSGVVVGSVADVDLKADTLQPVIDLRIQGRRGIPEDSLIRISSGLLVANPVIEIVPGRSKVMLKPDAVCKGDETGSVLAQLSPDLDRGMKAMADSMESVKGLMPRLNQTMDRVDGILSPAAGTMRNFERVSARAAQLADNRRIDKTLNSVLQDMEAITHSARSATSTLGTELTAMAKRNGGRVDDLMSEAFDLLQKLTETMDAAKNVVTRLADQLGDPRLQQSLQETVELARTTLARFHQIASDIHQMSGDPAVQSDLRSTLSNLEQASATGQKLADDVARMVSRLNLPTGGPKFGIGEPSLSIDFASRGDPPHFRSDVGVRFPLGKQNALHLGFYDFAEKNRLTAQYETTVQGFGALRYGLYAGKLGNGADIKLGQRTTLSLDAFDPNRLQVDARALVRMNEDFSLWLGADNIFKRTTPLVGVRLRR
jgi:phospholipid/cholesterol/gamma-HCH transport system substrate-binding protein